MSCLYSQLSPESPLQILLPDRVERFKSLHSLVQDDLTLCQWVSGSPPPCFPPLLSSPGILRFSPFSYMLQHTIVCCDMANYGLCTSSHLGKKNKNKLEQKTILWLWLCGFQCKAIKCCKIYRYFFVLFCFVLFAPPFPIQTQVSEKVLQGEKEGGGRWGGSFPHLLLPYFQCSL